MDPHSSFDFVASFPYIPKQSYCPFHGPLIFHMILSHTCFHVLFHSFMRCWSDVSYGNPFNTNLRFHFVFHVLLPFDALMLNLNP